MDIDSFRSIEPIIEEGERFNLSDDTIANMYNASLASTGKTDCYITQSQVNRLRMRLREKKLQESKGKKPFAIGIDERKDSTRVAVGVGVKGKKRYEMKKVENCSVIFWESDDNVVKDEYVGHVAPSEGTGKGLARAVMEFFKDRNTDTKDLVVVFNDGCS